VRFQIFTGIKTTKKNKINRQRNKNKSVKKQKKGGNRSFKKHSLANEIPDNLANEQNERILDRIRDNIQYCIELIPELEFQKEILFQEKQTLRKLCHMLMIIKLNQKFMMKLKEFIKK